MSLARLTLARSAPHRGLTALAGVTTRRDGGVAHIVLNRPAQLNTLSHDMVTVVLATLEDLAEEPGIDAVVLSGAGDRGLSAGGDLLALHQDAVGDGERAMPFWRDLYSLTEMVAEFPKPIIAIMDGLVLGGGLGVSARAAVRVVTERSVLGMPETRIGFFPDTGGLHLLAHLPGEVGTYLGMCAETIGAADALHIGLADRFVWSSDLPRLLDRLAVDPMEVALDDLASTAPAAPRLHGQDWIDHCFAGADPQGIIDRLRGHHEPDARAAGELLASRSPTAVTATLLGIRAAASLDLREDLGMELRLADALRRSPDFIEGIRARLVDKDREPRWSPASLDELAPGDLLSVVGRAAPRGAQA